MQSRAPVDLESLAKQLDALARDVAYLAERQRERDALLDEMSPDTRAAFARELARVGRRILVSYTLEDVRAFGDGITSILDTLRDLTQPTVLTIIDEASRTLQHADAVKPVGVVGVVRAAGEADVQKGLAVLLDVLRHVGRAAKAVASFRAADSPSSRDVNGSMLG